MTKSLVDQLVARAMALGSDAFADAAAEAELRQLAGGDLEALDAAIPAYLVELASLARRWQPIELLANVRYQGLPPP
jgi:hypothetical protein